LGHGGPGIGRPGIEPAGAAGSVVCGIDPKEFA
jgi:hypothetical protein